MQLSPDLAAIPPLINEVPLGALPLSGGLTNRSWRILTPSLGWVVWRANALHSQIFDICRRNEAKVINAVSPSIPTYQALKENEQGLLVSWIEGRPYQQPDPEPAIALLARIHSLAPDTSIRQFDFQTKVDHYWSHIHDRDLKARYNSFYQSFRAPPNLRTSMSAICHFDFGVHNLLESQGSIAVIDWEYAAIASPTLDLAMTLDMLGLEFKDGLKLYQKHHAVERPEDWYADMMDWKPHIDLMAMLWYVLAAQVWESGDFYTTAEQIYQRNC